MTTTVNPEVLEFCSIQVYVKTIFFSGHPTKNPPLRSDRVRELQKAQELQLMLNVNVSATTIRKRRKPKKPKKNRVE